MAGKKPNAQYASDRLQLFGPLISERALELARARITDPACRLVGKKGSLPTGDLHGTVKVALLLVREMNELEDLTHEEEAFLRGISADTYGKRVAGGGV